MGSRSEFSETELKLIEERYKKNLTKFVGLVILSFVFSFFLCVIPLDLLSRRGRHFDGNMLEEFGRFRTLIFFISSVSVNLYLANLMTIPFKLKNDLKTKIKITVDIKIKNRGMIPKKNRDELKKQGENLTDYVIFEKNKIKIKNHYFDRVINPEYLNAKVVQFEIAQHSKIVFSQKVI